MSAKYFLDTNIFVYSLDLTAPAKARRAAKLVRDGLDTGNGIVSYQVVQESFSVAFRKFARPMSGFTAEEYLNTVFRPLLEVHSSPALLVSALQVYGQHHLYVVRLVNCSGGASGGMLNPLQRGSATRAAAGRLANRNPFR
jgi:predicted nucleic acid-binding protein